MFVKMDSGRGLCIIRTVSRFWKVIREISLLVTYLRRVVNENCLKNICGHHYCRSV